MGHAPFQFGGAFLLDTRNKLKTVQGILQPCRSGPKTGQSHAPPKTERVSAVVQGIWSLHIHLIDATEIEWRNGRPNHRVGHLAGVVGVGLQGDVSARNHWADCECDLVRADLLLPQITLTPPPPHSLRISDASSPGAPRYSVKNLSSELSNYPP